jgi:hypothetical protein
MRRVGIDWPRLTLWLGVIALAGPAIWNGFAIVFFDTGGYIRRVLDGGLEAGRSLFYGQFLYASSLGWLSFWGPVLAQCAATVWLIHLCLRAHTIGPAGWPPQARAGAMAVLLSAVTGIAWYSSQLMPDIWMPLLVLCLWLLGFKGYTLSTRERTGVALIALLSLLSHMSGMALAIGLVAVIGMARLLAPRLGWKIQPRLLPPFAIVAASLILMPMAHLALVGQAGYTPGGPYFLYGRLVQDGLAQRYLADHCPTDGSPAPYKLCALQSRLPDNANDFLWREDSPLNDIGGWQGAEPELAALVKATILAYPGPFLLTGLKATGDQLLTIRTGDGLTEWHDMTRRVFDHMLPSQKDLEFNAARQQKQEISPTLFTVLNLAHVPVGYLSMIGLLLVIGWGLRQDRHDLAALALFVALALLGNAFINGALSNPHDRYQSRMIWLATMVVAMAAVAWSEGRRETPANTIGQNS